MNTFGGPVFALFSLTDFTINNQDPVRRTSFIPSEEADKEDENKEYSQADNYNNILTHNILELELFTMFYQ